MSQVIDRRLNGKNKSIVNRQRFIRRYRSAIKKAVSDAVDGRGIRDFDCGDRVSIPAKDVSEPVFRHGQGGRQETIHPGNKEFVSGDHVERPSGSGGGGGGSGDQAGNSGTGEDDFVFQLTREEFVELFFEDLALPDMVKTKLASLDSVKSVRAGHSSEGMPCNINVVRSLRGATARRIALGGPHKTRLRAIEAELQELQQLEIDEGENTGARFRELNDEVLQLRGRIRGVPFIDTFDLRYNNRIQQPRPTTQAVMFCLMDVSGSMSQARKDIAKRFFILLYLFLERTYERIDVVFIRHHTAAKEVEEDEFFHSRETGGTIVSSALEMTHEIISDRYPSDDWNIYAAQASDGDNWAEDSPKCQDILVNKLMPALQYFAYVEIAARYHQSLWEEYTRVADMYPNFAMRQIEDTQRIYPVFSDLFRKRAQ